MLRRQVLCYLVVYINYFLLRASVMLFVLRLLPAHQKWQQRIIYLAFSINIAITILATVTYGISCIPFKANWQDIPNARCLPKNVLVIVNQVNSILACVCDIITVLIPQILLWKVQMRPKTVRMLKVILALSLIPAGLSIARAVITTEKDMTEDTTCM